MRTRMLKVILLGSVIAVGIAGCNHSTEEERQKVEDAKNNLTAAQQQLDQARQDSINDEVKYKQESEATLAENRKRIAQLKGEMQEEKREVRDKYDKELDKLEQENQQLEVRLNEYKDEGTSNWKKFKYGFNKDL